MWASFEDASIDVDGNKDDYGNGLKILPSCPDDVKEAQDTAFNPILPVLTGISSFTDDQYGTDKAAISR